MCIFACTHTLSTGLIVLTRLCGYYKNGEDENGEELEDFIHD